MVTEIVRDSLMGHEDNIYGTQNIPSSNYLHKSLKTRSGEYNIHGTLHFFLTT